MRVPLIMIAVGMLATNLVFPLPVRADQAILTHDALFTLSPGEAVEHTGSLILSRYGIPTVMFDGSSGFGDNETVLATITLGAADGIGTVELLGPSILTGTTPSNWRADPPDPVSSEFTFDPPISVRYTAPDEAALDRAGHPGESFRTRLEVAATLVGSAGTRASFSGDSFPSVVTFDVICPVAAAAVDPTPATVPSQAPPKQSGATPRPPSPTPPTPEATPTPVPTTTPASTPFAASAVTSPTAIAIVEPTATGTAAPVPSLATDMTPTAISFPAIASVIAAGLAIWLARRRGSG